MFEWLTEFGFLAMIWDILPPTNLHVPYIFPVGQVDLWDFNLQIGTDHQTLAQIAAFSTSLDDTVTYWGFRLRDTLGGRGGALWGEGD